MSKSWPPEKQVLLQWLWLKGCFTAQCYGNPPGMFIWEVPPICSHLLKIKQQRKNTKKQQLKQPKNPKSTSIYFHVRAQKYSLVH